MNQNLSRALFHGTIETLKEGDRITPGGTDSHAWATSDLNYALEHAQGRTKSGFGANTGNGGEWPVHHGNVYEVEQIDPDEHEHTAMENAVASKKGFRVKRQVASVLGPKDDRETIKRRFPDFNPAEQSYVPEGRYRPI